MSEFHILIPARLASTRLPEKALAMVAGQPLILHTLARALDCRAASVHVATDSEAIAEVVREAGHAALMTAADHRSGTDRLAEAVEQLGLPAEAVVVNLQGDEPRMPAACLAQVAGLLGEQPQAHMATLWSPIKSAVEWQSPSVVKLVSSADGRALYFSRAGIPAARDVEWPKSRACRHIGLYAYRAAALLEWQRLPASELEQLESLEQLRALEAGWWIATARALEPVPAGIDTPEDLAELRASLA